MQLQRIQPGGSHGLGDRAVLCINEQADAGYAPLGPGGQSGRIGQRQIARALGEEHEARVGGAGGDGRLQRRHRGEAADLDGGSGVGGIHREGFSGGKGEGKGARV